MKDQNGAKRGFVQNPQIEKAGLPALLSHSWQSYDEPQLRLVFFVPGGIKINDLFERSTLKQIQR